MSTIQLYLLGILEMRCDDQPLPKPPMLKSQSLLACLILHRDRPQTYEHLTGLFGGDRSERSALQSLATALWHIRCRLPNGDSILSEDHSVESGKRGNDREYVQGGRCFSARPSGAPTLLAPQPSR